MENCYQVMISKLEELNELTELMKKNEDIEMTNGEYTRLHGLLRSIDYDVKVRAIWSGIDV